MNCWKEIWTGYHFNATRLEIVKSYYKHSSLIEKIVFLILSVLMFSAAIMYFREQGWWFAILLVIEIPLLIQLMRLKDKYVLNEYGDTSKNIEPPETKNQQSTRYLIFKAKLKELGISNDDVQNCFDLVDAQIDISTSRTSHKIFSSFIFGVTLGLIGSAFKKLELEGMIKLFFGCLSISYVFYAISSFFLSKLEKLHELKYFMKLYCHEYE